MDKRNQSRFSVVYFFLFYKDISWGWRRQREGGEWIISFLKLLLFRTHQFLFYRRLVLHRGGDLKNLPYVQEYFLYDPREADQSHWSLRKCYWCRVYRLILSTESVFHFLSKATSTLDIILQAHRENPIRTHGCLAVCGAKGIFHKHWWDHWHQSDG